ncbi:hypothetical protein D7V90_07870 [bacterium 1xD42-87]|nr:hypothetical protein D7V90_07870 [bacterium 1xD42-87]
MAKKNYYCIKASKGNACDTISFEKDEDDMICICMEGEELRFTVKEAKEIADKLRKCANE